MLPGCIWFVCCWHWGRLVWVGVGAAWLGGISPLGIWSIRNIFTGKGIGQGFGIHVWDMVQVSCSWTCLSFTFISKSIFLYHGFYSMGSWVLVGFGSSTWYLGQWGVNSWWYWVQIRVSMVLGLHWRVLVCVGIVIVELIPLCNLVLKAWGIDYDLKFRSRIRLNRVSGPVFIVGSFEVYMWEVLDG